MSWAGRYLVLEMPELSESNFHMTAAESPPYLSPPSRPHGPLRTIWEELKAG